MISNIYIYLYIVCQKKDFCNFEQIMNSTERFFHSSKKTRKYINTSKLHIDLSACKNKRNSHSKDKSYQSSGRIFNRRQTQNIPQKLGTTQLQKPINNYYIDKISSKTQIKTSYNFLSNVDRKIGACVPFMPPVALSLNKTDKSPTRSSTNGNLNRYDIATHKFHSKRSYMKVRDGSQIKYSRQMQKNTENIADMRKLQEYHHQQQYLTYSENYFRKEMKRRIQNNARNVCHEQLQNYPQEIKTKQLNAGQQQKQDKHKNIHQLMCILKRSTKNHKTQHKINKPINDRGKQIELAIKQQDNNGKQQQLIKQNNNNNNNNNNNINNRQEDWQDCVIPNNNKMNNINNTNMNNTNTNNINMNNTNTNKNNNTNNNNNKSQMIHPKIINRQEQNDNKVDNNKNDKLYVQQNKQDNKIKKQEQKTQNRNKQQVDRVVANKKNTNNFWSQTSIDGQFQQFLMNSNKNNTINHNTNNNISNNNNNVKQIIQKQKKIEQLTQKKKAGQQQNTNNKQKRQINSTYQNKDDDQLQQIDLQINTNNNTKNKNKINSNNNNNNIKNNNNNNIKNNNYKQNDKQNNNNKQYNNNKQNNNNNNKQLQTTKQQQQNKQKSHNNIKLLSQHQFEQQLQEILYNIYLLGEHYANTKQFYQQKYIPYLKNITHQPVQQLKNAHNYRVCNYYMLQHRYNLGDKALFILKNKNQALYQLTVQDLLAHHNKQTIQAHIEQFQAQNQSVKKRIKKLYDSCKQYLPTKQRVFSIDPKNNDFSQKCEKCIIDQFKKFQKMYKDTIRQQNKHISGQMLKLIQYRMCILIEIYCVLKRINGMIDFGKQYTDIDTIDNKQTHYQKYKHLIY